MNEFRKAMIRIQELVGSAFTTTGSLVALADGGQMNPQKLQQTLEKTTAEFEKATLELRVLCETYSPGVGGYGKRPEATALRVTGRVERLGYNWLHITLNTLLPHCRFQPPDWLSDTIRRLLDDYEAGGKPLPYFRRALLVIDEHSQIDGRHTFDQDNKGYKAVSNAIKGRLIPDDDQYTLNVALLSVHSPENVCHIYLMELADAPDFFALQTGEFGADSLRGGAWF